MLKIIGKLMILLTVIYFVYQIWQNTGQQIKNEPRYELPKAINELPKSDFKQGTQKLRLTKIDSRSTKQQIDKTYRYLFDSLELTKMNYDQLKHTDLLAVDAVFIETMLRYNETVQENAYDSRKKTLLLVGTLLEDINEVKIMVKYLHENDIWTKQTARNHYLLMQYPKDEVAKKAYRLLLSEASSSEIIDFFEEIQFLYRHPGDEYYDTYPKTIEKLDNEMLVMLKDKIDDYSWWAAYPEKDACDAIDKIWESRK